MNPSLEPGIIRRQATSPWRRWSGRFAACAGLLAAFAAYGQTVATLTDLGATAPTPGLNDISQFSTAGDVLHPDGLNYFTDNQTSHDGGEPGQTFTTGGNPGGYWLTSLVILTPGLGDNNGIGTPQPYYLHLYSVAGGTATPLQTNVSANFIFNDGDWLQWSNLSLNLSSNTTYAYSFGEASDSGGWEGLAVASGNPYAGGEIGLFPPGGGAVTYGPSHAFDAVFDLGLTVSNSVSATAPAASPTNTPVYAGTLETLTEVAGGITPFYYQWQTDGGGGGTLTNIHGATLTNLTVNTSGFAPGTYKFDVVVTNVAGAFTSAVVALVVVAASPPVLASDITPASAQGVIGGTQTFSATFTGTLPIAYQWQANTGGGATNIPGATKSSLTLANLQVSNSGSYRVQAINLHGGPVASSFATLNVANASYVSAILAANPVGYWRLNEAGSPTNGTLVAADAEKHFNGVYGSAATDGVGGPTPALGFQGFETTNTSAGFEYGVAKSFVTLPDLNLNTNTITITAWIYPVGAPPANCGLVFCRPGGDASGFNFSTGGQLGYTWNQNNSDSWSWNSGLVPPLQQWSFVSLVISPQNAVIYLCNTNGVQSATNAVASTAEAFNASTLIGNDPADGGNGGRNFNGDIDEVAIFNYSLSGNQVQDLYFGGVGGGPKVGLPSASPASTVFAGNTVTLSANVLGAPPFQYQWQSNSVNIAGATNASLVLTNVTVADSAGYAVIASNSSGASESPTLALVVNPASQPVFTRQPSPSLATNYVGGFVTLAATVDGTPPIQLQWQFNGTNLPFATASSLTLAALQASEAGAYTLQASNSFGVTNSLAAVLTVLPPPNPAALNVLTYHNDNTRAGANTNEVLLTPATVNAATFGLLRSYPVDGYVYAQPLYVAGLAIPGQGAHNTVFVATENDSVYAFDADGIMGTNGGLLWHASLGTAALSNNHEFGDRYNGNNYTDIVPEVGITGTPVINPANGTLYVDVRTRIVYPKATNYYHLVHALNITNGAEQPYSPVAVTNSVPGKGVDSVNGLVTFNAVQENQRPGLTLAGGMVYVAYGSFADTDPYHGWVIGFNATNLQASAAYVFNVTPNATVSAFGANAAEGALWMGGNGLCVDTNNNLFFETANGSFSANTNGGDYSDSFMRLSSSNGLVVADYFTPYDQAGMQASDSDLGSGGPVLLPDSVGSAAHPHLIVGAGKAGDLFLVDRDNMGRYNANNNNQIVQEVGGAIGAAFSTPAYFNGQIYYQGVGDVMKAFAIANGAITPTPVSSATTSFSALGGTPSISANGTNNAIVWTIQSDAYGSGGPAILHAYNATNLAQELYNSSQNSARDNPGGAIQMTTPTVVNGKVIVGAQYAVSIFGNSLFLATPTIAPAGGLFTNAVTVTLADATPNSTIYYTLDGTTPTTNSLVYEAPFTLTTSASVQAMAAQRGAVNSGVASADFVDSSAIGAGTGLLGSYWSHTTGVAFTNASFSVPANLVRTDATVNFNWTGSPPAAAIGLTNFVVRWTGAVQPEYNETYTFSTTTAGGVRLYVNGQLLIDHWVNQAATTWSNSITLAAQERYNLEMEYFDQTGGAVAQLYWSSPSTPNAIIPQTQLYPVTNPPPAVELTSPANGAAYTAAATVSVSANADALYNPLSNVSFYTNGVFLGAVSNAPYALTATGLGAGSYVLTAVATDGSGLSSTSAAVTISVSTGTGLPYGQTTNGTLGAFLNNNLPGSYAGSLPPLLSETGAFADTPNRVPASGLIPYVPNTTFWSDGAVKSRYLGLPCAGGLISPAQQIGFAPTGQWTFPAGTVFVKNFDLVVNATNPSVPVRRLETRLLVRDTNGAVYGVTYKWRPDNSDADLLTGSETEAILVTNATGVFAQNWYYPSPADCLTCHTPVAGYVLGASTRQFNGQESYPVTGVTDNQLRTLNRLGLFNPAFDEAAITNFEQMCGVTNQSAPLAQRARSYLDANCSQCHQPGGTGITFDARYDTPLTNQNLINAMASFSLGYDHTKIVAPSDVWRSSLYDRMNSVDPAIKMPPLARNLIDTNGVEAMAEWINSLGGTPALAPPVLAPASGIFTNRVVLALQSPDTNAALYYTLDGSLPTTNSTVYTGPFQLTSSEAVTASAFEPGYVNSVAVSGVFTIVPPLYNLFALGLALDGTFQMQYWAPAGQTYILQYSTNLVTWTSLSTNMETAAPFILTDPQADTSAERFYRVVTPQAP